MNEETRIYVADLAAYNSGTSHGVWVNATDDTGDIQDQINQMLVKSPVKNAGEYAIHASEGFDGYNIGEFTHISKAHEIAFFLEEFPDYAEETNQERVNELPKDLHLYIDYERMAHDWECNGSYTLIEENRDCMHIF